MGWRRSVLDFTRTVPGYLAMNGMAHTVLWFHLQLRKHRNVEDDPCFGDAPDGCVCSMYTEQRIMRRKSKNMFFSDCMYLWGISLTTLLITLHAAYNVLLVTGTNLHLWAVGFKYISPATEMHPPSHKTFFFSHDLFFGNSFNNFFLEPSNSELQNKGYTRDSMGFII